ncbi:MAG: hypothetical protein K6U00_04215, partial [Armatimonadetes bacterium]|nr:hypothetical protein [Armatimonadota bacterium]
MSEVSEGWRFRRSLSYFERGLRSTASIPAVVQEFSSSGRNVVYIREPDGSLVARFEPGENPVADYYYFDGLGSTVMMTQGLSTITDR